MRKTPEWGRKIDERALHKPGGKWFSIHAREGIERELAEATRETLTAIESAAEE